MCVPARYGSMRCRYSSSLRYTLPTPAITVWSISSAPIGLRDLMIRAQARRRVGVAPQRVGPEPGDHVGDLGLLDHLAHRRAAQVGAVFGADHPHPDLPDGQRHRHGHLGERAVQAEMDVHDAAAVVVVEQVLAPGGGLLEDPSVDRGGAVGEPALRAATPCTGARPNRR